MIQIQSYLHHEHLNSGKWAFEHGTIKGYLEVYVNGDVLLVEPNMNVVDLAIQLGEWLQSVRRGVMRDFVYESLDQDGPVLHFSMQQDGILISSTWQNDERHKLLSLEDVVNAVTRYLVSLNMKLHEMDYFEKLDRFLPNNLSENAKALMLFEQNEYDAALALLKRLAEEQRDVQSLNNLAWMYLHEEEDRQTAKSLLLEVLSLNPQSYFPYNMLGEIALANGDLQLAETYLMKSLQLKHSEEGGA